VALLEQSANDVVTQLVIRWVAKLLLVFQFRYEMKSIYEV